MRRKVYVAWSGVQESLTMILYDIIKELLRIQSRQDTLHQTEMLQAIADSTGDMSQTEGVTIHSFSILSQLKVGAHSSPLNGVIPKALRARWDLNSLSPQIWTQGYRQRKAMYTAGVRFNPEETLQLIYLTAEVMQRHFRQGSAQHAYHPPEGNIEESVSFLQTGSSWLRELTIDSVCNWSLINQLTTELILNVVIHRQDDPTTFGNCIHILCLLSSTDEFECKISGLGRVEKIIKLLPRQFPDKKGEDASYSTWTQSNNNLHLTLRTLRHLTEPDINNPHYPRIGTGANLRGVLGTLRAWGGDDTSKGLTLQVLYNLMREVDEMHNTPQRRPLPRPDISPGETRGTTGACHVYLGTHIASYLNSNAEGSVEPGPITQAQGILHGLEMDTHTIETVTRTLLNQPSHHHVAQSMGLRILQGITPRGYILTTWTPRERDLKWTHPASDTYFDTLPDLATITVNLTHWHSYKGTWKTREGSISVPLPGNITQLIQMLLWNHPYVESTSFLQGTTAYDATLGDRIQIPLNSEIRTLGSTAQKLIIHLLLPHWESGHLDLTPTEFTCACEYDCEYTHRIYICTCIF